jgi:hypothetical protein
MTSSLHFLTKTLYAFLISTMHAMCPNHLILDLITWIIFHEQCKSWSSPSLWDPNIFLTTLFSDTLNVWTSLGVGDQVVL